MNWFKKEQNIYFVILTIVYIVFTAIFWGRFGNPIVDSGREAFIPYSMAYLGKILFKDLICIYGPLPYYLNAFVLKVFGPHLNVMYFLGAFASYVFLVFGYLIAKRFLGAKCSLIFSLAMLFTCIYKPVITNFIFPYSYAMVYALAFSMVYIFFILKYIEKKETKYLYLSALFLSLCVLSKYDFAPCILILASVAFLYRKNLGIANIFKFCLVFFAPFFLILLIMLFQGVHLSNLLFNFKMMSNMAHSPSLAYFYSNYTGYIFSFKKINFLFPHFVKYLLTFTLIFGIGFYSARIKNKLGRYAIFLLIAAFCLAALSPIVLKNQTMFALLPLLLVFYILYKLVRLFIQKRFLALSNFEIEQYVFILFAILVSFKSFFMLDPGVYGTYYIPIVFLATCVVLSIMFKGAPKETKTGIGLINLVLFVLFLSINTQLIFGEVKFPIKTPSGTIYVESLTAPAIAESLPFFYNLKEDEDFLILPEGLFLNFAFRKDYKYFNTSFIPLDFDAYGEDYLLKGFLADLPKYVLVTNRNTADYAKPFLCKDYGHRLCEIISEKYTFRRTFGSKTNPALFMMLLFERND